MRFNVLSILSASMLVTAGLSAATVNLAGAFDLNGELAKCAPGDKACVDLAQAKNVCWTQKSDVQSELDNCLADANRAYDMARSGAPADVVAANASGEKSVTTDADLANLTSPNADGKGHGSAR